MARKPAKPPAPSPEAENERLYRDHLLSRYLRVIARGNDVIEVAPRPGHRLQISDEVNGDRRRVRVLVAPIKAP